MIMILKNIRTVPKYVILHFEWSYEQQYWNNEEYPNWFYDSVDQRLQW